jgi:hypothetical protein
MNAIRTAFLGLGFLALAGCKPSAKPIGKVVVPDTPEAVVAEEDRGKNLGGKFTISKETTWVTEPLDRDGYVDYAAAFNKQMQKGVTPDNNANALLWKAHGPLYERMPVPAEFFREMGIPVPPEYGEYYTNVELHLRRGGPFVSDSDIKEVQDQLKRATQRPWKAKGQPKLAAWLKANEKPLAHVVAASRRSRYYLPMVPPKTRKGSSGLVNALLPGVQQCRELANALTARAMLRVGEGEYEDAWQDLLACHRLGRLIGQGGSLIQVLVCISIDRGASGADLAFLDRAKLDAKRIEKCLRDLQKLPPLPDLAEKVNLGERFVFLDMVMLIARHGLDYLEVLGGGKPSEPNPFAELMLAGTDWDPALRNANKWFDCLVAILRNPDRASRVKELSQFSDDLWQLKTRAAQAASKASPTILTDARARGEAVGNIMISLLMPNVPKVQDALDRARQTQDNLTLAFALAWYRGEHGRYPKSLDALAPKYLRQIPADLFSGKALRYRASENGYLLSSVGGEGDDLSVRMPLPGLREK